MAYKILERDHNGCNKNCTDHENWWDCSGMWPPLDYHGNPIECFALDLTPMSIQVRGNG